MSTCSPTPTILSLQDLDGVVEGHNPQTGAFEYITFYTFNDDDVVFFGKLSQPRDEASVSDINAALERVPDCSIFPVLPLDPELTIAPEASTQQDDCFIKRPNMSVYELFVDHDREDTEPGNDGFLARTLLSEALIMQRLSGHPHPNLAKYHGVRVRRGRITGLVFKRYQRTLLDHVRQGLHIDQDEVLHALEPAVTHLHSLGLAHNDIHPENIMMDPDSTPVLIDFGSCQPFGKRLVTRGTEGWVDDMGCLDALEGGARQVRAWEASGVARLSLV